MVIRKIRYRFNEYEQLHELSIQNQSGAFKENEKPVRQGTLVATEVTAYSPDMTPELNKELSALVSKGAIFELEDATGNTYIIGNNSCKAAFEFDKKNDGKAGSKFGYDLKITWNSANGAEFKSFQEG